MGEEGVAEAPERLKWTRTFILALGAAAGVLVTAYLIHVFRKG